jgi:hypothetical protein
VLFQSRDRLAEPRLQGVVVLFQSRDRLAEPRLQGAVVLFQSRDRKGAVPSAPPSV